MSDISPNSSFELISDSDFSDVDEPSVVSDQFDYHIRNRDESSVVKPKVFEAKVLEVNKSSGHSDSSFEQVIASDQSDIDKSPFESDRSANDLQNTDHSDVIEQKVVVAEAIGLLIEKVASIRRMEDQADINQATDHSDDGDLLNTSRSDVVESNIVEYRAIHRKRLLIACVLLILIGVSTFLSGPPSVQDNANPIVKKFAVTMVNQGEVYNFSEEKKQKIRDDMRTEQEEFYNFTKISKRRISILQVTGINQVPANLRDKFVPDYAKFEGVYGFLQQTQTNGTIVEDYLYCTKPRLTVNKQSSSLNFVHMDTLKVVKGFRIEDCEKFSKSCHHFHWFMKNGNLYIKETFVLNSEEYKFTRVYFIPPHKMI